MRPLVSFLFCTGKGFYFNLSQSTREQHRSFSHESAALDTHLPIPNSSVWFAENKKDPFLGGAVNCGFLLHLAEANVSLHKYWLSFPLCTQGVMAVTVLWCHLSASQVWHEANVLWPNCSLEITAGISGFIPRERTMSHEGCKLLKRVGFGLFVYVYIQVA